GGSAPHPRRTRRRRVTPPPSCAHPAPRTHFPPFVDRGKGGRCVLDGVGVDAYPWLMTGSLSLQDALSELVALDDPKMRAANEKRGDDHGINLSRLRALAKRIKTDQELAR